MPGVYPWAPGQAAVGSKAFNEPVIVNGLMQIQKGTYSFPPSVTAPGTVASGGTVANTTGYNCWVYASASTGISAVKVVNYNGANSGTLTTAGTVPALGQGSYFVPGPGAIIVSYSGSLSWAWQGL
jgi:hypothetical protein